MSKTIKGQANGAAPDEKRPAKIEANGITASERATVTQAGGPLYTLALATSLISRTILEFCEQTAGAISTGGPWMPSDAPEFQGRHQPYSAGSGMTPVRNRHTGGPVGDEFSFLQHGEFVMPTHAVQHYGVDLMHGIKDMRVPMHHAGGAIGSLRSPASAKGGDVHVANYVDIKLLSREMGSRQGRRIIVDVLRGSRIELGR
jgi:hypothetical protein